jgi:hypothetical protein
MSQVIIAGDTSGTITLQAPAVSGSTTLTLPAATGTVMVSGNMPAFSAYGSGVQSIANATATKIQFNTKLYDTNTVFDTTNYRFTPNVAGYYQINCSVYYAASAIGQGGLYFYKNGSQFTIGNSLPLYSGASVNLFSSALIYLNGSTDYVEIYAYQSSGGSLNVGSGGTNQLFSGFLARGA